MSTSQNGNQTKSRRLLFHLVKGFIYGNVIGLIFGTSVYLLASAVNTIASAMSQTLPISPVMFLLLIYGTSVTAGTVVEYSDWLEGEQ